MPGAAALEALAVLASGARTEVGGATTNAEPVRPVITRPMETTEPSTVTIAPEKRLVVMELHGRDPPRQIEGATPHPPRPQHRHQ